MIVEMSASDTSGKLYMTVKYAMKNRIGRLKVKAKFALTTVDECTNIVPSLAKCANANIAKMALAQFPYTYILLISHLLI